MEGSSTRGSLPDGSVIYQEGALAGVFLIKYPFYSEKCIFIKQIETVLSYKLLYKLQVSSYI